MDGLTVYHNAVDHTLAILALMITNMIPAAPEFFCDFTHIPVRRKHRFQAQTLHGRNQAIYEAHHRTDKTLCGCGTPALSRCSCPVSGFTCMIKLYKMYGSPTVTEYL